MDQSSKGSTGSKAWFKGIYYIIATLGIISALGISIYATCGQQHLSRYATELPLKIEYKSGFMGAVTSAWQQVISWVKYMPTNTTTPDYQGRTLEEREYDLLSTSIEIGRNLLGINQFISNEIEQNLQTKLEEFNDLKTSVMAGDFNNQLQQAQDSFKKIRDELDAELNEELFPD